MFFPPMIGLGTVALVALVLMISTRSGSLTRNLAIGIRTKYTLASDEAWAAGQLSSLPYLLAISLTSAAHIAALLTVEFLGLPDWLGNSFAMSGFGVIVITSLLAWRTANKAAKAISGSRESPAK